MSNLTPDQEMQERYRMLFGTHQGKTVLADLLYEMSVFGTAHDDLATVFMNILLQKTGFVSEWDDRFNRPTRKAYESMVSHFVQKGNE